MVALVVLVSSSTMALGSEKKLTDAQIKQMLIEESIADYSGNCPCPYSRASNGSRCGRRSEDPPISWTG
jgi:hypothetical protein